jgi:hypothetical protein
MECPFPVTIIRWINIKPEVYTSMPSRFVPYTRNKYIGKYSNAVLTNFGSLR